MMIRRCCLPWLTGRDAVEHYYSQGAKTLLDITRFSQLATIQMYMTLQISKGSRSYPTDIRLELQVAFFLATTTQLTLASLHNNNGKRWLPSQPHLLQLAYSCIARNSWLTPIAHNGTYLCDRRQDRLLFKLTDQQSGIWKIDSFHNDQNVLASKAQVNLQDWNTDKSLKLYEGEVRHRFTQLSLDCRVQSLHYTSCILLLVFWQAT